MRTLEGASLLEHTDALAVRAHAGQTDKAGRDYIDHPRRVAARLPTVELKAVALLHDVVEDSGFGLDALRAKGIPEAVCDAVEALSKREGEAHSEAVARAAVHPLARAVKAADVADNIDPDRLALLDDDAEAARLRDKYTRARQVLAATADHLYGPGRRVLVVDDLRTFDDLPDAAYARTSGQALALLAWHVLTPVRLDELWLDHDLGGDDDVRAVVRWLEERYHDGAGVPIGRVVAHTSNPVGGDEIVRALGRWVPVERIDASTRRVRST